VTAAPDPVDEGRHEPSGEPLWNESYYLDFTTADGTLGGYVRIGLYPALGVAWYWGCVVGEGRPLVTVIEQEAPLPSRSTSLEVRSEGLWCDHTVEEPYEHFTLGLEAFGVSVDDPAEVYRDGGMRGDRTALGFDLEWETDGGVYPYPGVTRYEIPCRVHGEILVGDERIELDGHGQRDHSWGTRDWWSFGWVWTAGRLDDGTRFHASDIRIPNVDVKFGYVVPPAGELRHVPGFETTEELGAEGFPTTARMALDDLRMDVTPLHFSPVRLDAPDGRVSRFPRALCRFADDGGRSGYGWTEWNQPQV
jgi:hypothetical protein